MKFVVFALLFALVALAASNPTNDWREGVLDSRCPAVDNPLRAHTFAHVNCAWFWKCNGGWACKLISTRNLNFE